MAGGEIDRPFKCTHTTSFADLGKRWATVKLLVTNFCGRYLDWKSLFNLFKSIGASDKIAVGVADVSVAFL